MPRFATKILEFDKVKKLLQEKAATFLGKEAVANLRISNNPDEVNILLNETEDALRILNEGKRLPFGGIKNILAALKKANIGSVLEAEELLHISSTLNGFANIKDFLIFCF